MKRNDIVFKELPPLFEGFTILHLSDMHVDMNEFAMQHLIELVGRLEVMKIRMLLNESAVIVRGDQQIYLAGIDDAHCFKVDNIEAAASQIPSGKFSILLSHTPEIYRQAAHSQG